MNRQRKCLTLLTTRKKNPDIAFTILPIRSFPEARICSFNYPSVDSFCSAATKKVKLIFPACLIDDQRDDFFRRLEIETLRGHRGS